MQGYETKQACDVKDADEATVRRPWQQAFPLFEKGWEGFSGTPEWGNADLPEPTPGKLLPGRGAKERVHCPSSKFIVVVNAHQQQHHQSL